MSPDHQNDLCTKPGREVALSKSNGSTKPKRTRGMMVRSSALSLPIGCPVKKERQNETTGCGPVKSFGGPHMHLHSGPTTKPRSQYIVPSARHLGA